MALILPYQVWGADPNCAVKGNIELFPTEGAWGRSLSGALIVLTPSDGRPRGVGYPGAKQDEVLMFAAGCGHGQGIPAVWRRSLHRTIHSCSPIVAVPPHLLALHAKSQLEMERLEKMRRDLREAVLTAAILASGMWIIVSGLMKLWGE
jgi:hypothetical protein